MRKKQNPKLKDLFPHALHRVLVVSGVSYLNVCQRDVVSLCMMSQDPSVDSAYEERSLEWKITRAGESLFSLVSVHSIHFCNLLLISWHLSQFQ